MKNEQNGTSRRSMFAGLMSLPAVAVAASGQRARPDVVRQSELQELVDADTRQRAAITSMRKRMRDGAVVETGKIRVKSDSDEGYPLEWSAEPIGGFYASGLDMNW